MKVRSLRKRTYRKAGGPRRIGLRCKEYCAGCIVCECYRFLDDFGRFPSFDEAMRRGEAAVLAEEVLP